MKGFLTALILFSNIAVAQHSVLYDKNGKLIIDRSYSIDKNSYGKINLIEKYLLPAIYNNIKYPAVAREDGNEGVVIVQLSIDNKIMSYSYKIMRADAEVFKQPVLSFFSKLSKNIKDEICPPGQSILVFIPVKFFITQNSFKKSFQKNHSVTIETNDIAPEAVQSQ